MGGSSKDPNKAAMKFQREQAKRLQGIDLPELEEYLLQSPELVGLLEAEQLDPSTMEEISLDPQLRANQMKVLQDLAQRSEEGLTQSDKFEMEKLLGDVAAQEQSRQAGIEAQMAQRGLDTSGAALVAKQQSSQSAANQAREKAMQMAAQAQQNKLAALSQLGAQSGQMESQDFGRQSQIASARDAIARANAMNRQQVAGQNLAARQAIANQRTNITNQQAQLANQLAQQQFSNEMARAGAQGGVVNNMASIAGNAPQKPSMAQGALAGGATGATFGPWGAAIGAGVGALATQMEDGGIARKNQEDELKQHAAFKKQYMKKIHDEILGKGSEKPVIKAAKGLKGDVMNPVTMKPSYTSDGIFDFNNTSREDIIKQGRGTQLGVGNDKTSAEIQTAEDANKVLNKDEESQINGESLEKGLGALQQLLGPKDQEKVDYDLQNTVMIPENVMTPVQPSQFANPFAAADGGTPYDAIMKEKHSDNSYGCGGVHKKAENGDVMYASDGMGDIVDSGMESYAGDRVDAKINDGEAILNVPQQQRMMDLLRGKIGLTELGDDDIVEGVPRDYRDDLHEKIEEESRGKDAKMEGLEKLLKMLGK